MTDNELRADMEKYREMLYKLAYGCTGDLSCCDDIVQETFVKLYLRGKPLPSEEDKKAWLIRVAVNLSRNHVRSGYFRHTEEIPENIGISEEIDDAIDLKGALKRLKPKYRSAIYLHYYMGCTAAETGRILHISETAVTTRLQRGREQLKKFLESEN